MGKIHTRLKRAFKLSTHLNHYRFFHPKEKPNRQRTFRTEDAAKKWASENKLKSFEVLPAKRGKRFRVNVR